PGRSPCRREAAQHAALVGVGHSGKSAMFGNHTIRTLLAWRCDRQMRQYDGRSLSLSRSERPLEPISNSIHSETDSPRLVVEIDLTAVSPDQRLRARPCSVHPLRV